MQAVQDIDPSTNSIDGHAHTCGEVAVDELVRGSMDKDLDERFELVDDKNGRFWVRRDSR